MSSQLKAWIPQAVLDLRLRLKEEARFFSERSVWGEHRFFDSVKNTKKGKRAFLIATGPSLKLEDLSVLKGEYCVSASNFFLHEQCKEIVPAFHCFAPYHDPWTENDFLGWVRDANEALPKQTGILTSFSMRPALERAQFCKERELRTLFLTQSRTFMGADCSRPIEAPASVPLMVLPFLIHQGFSEIYLLGCDHTVLRDFGRASITHFYDSSRDPRMKFLKDKLWDDVRYELDSLSLVFDRYRRYQEVASAQEIKIFNLSQDSWLSFFQRKSLGELF